MSKVFLAFGGRPDDNLQLFGIKKKFVSKDLIIYNLREYTKAELESDLLAQEKLLLPYPHIVDTFSIEYFDVQRQDEPICWGILINHKDIEDYTHYIFFIELYINRFITPIFYVGKLGYNLLEFDHRDVWEDNVTNFIDQGLLKFISKLSPQKQYVGYNINNINVWLSSNKLEEFRFMTATNLYLRLKEMYFSKKSIFFGLIELLDIAVVFENLFTEHDEKDNIGLILRKRIHLLTGELIVDIETEIRNLYAFRSRYAHGNIHLDLQKGFMDNQGYIPLLTYKSGAYNRNGENIFELSKKYTKILRIVLIFMYMLDLKGVYSNESGYKNIIDLLDQAMFDSKSKNKIHRMIATISKLMPVYGLNK